MQVKITKYCVCIYRHFCTAIDVPAVPWVFLLRCGRSCYAMGVSAALRTFLPGSLKDICRAFRPDVCRHVCRDYGCRQKMPDGRKTIISVLLPSGNTFFNSIRRYFLTTFAGDFNGVCRVFSSVRRSGYPQCSESLPSLRASAPA